MGKLSAQALQQAVRVMTRRIYGSGVRDFDVYTQGDNIVIELPRAKNDAQVLRIVGQRGELFFRPVECIIAPPCWHHDQGADHRQHDLCGFGDLQAEFHRAGTLDPL